MLKPKKLILIFLISFFTLIFFQIGSLKAESSVTVNVTSYFDEENQILTEVTNQTYGSKVSFSSNLSTDEGYTFVYWIYNGIIREDIPQNYAFTVTSDTELVAIFRPNDKFAAVFMDANGHLIDVQYVLPSGDALDIDNGLLPTKPGYEIATPKWNNSLSNILGNTIYVLQYNKIESATYSLTVTNGTGDGTYAYNSYATITADTLGDGLYFNYWKIGDKIVSNTPTYKFTVLDDITIEAVYSEIANQGIPMISIVDNLALRDGYQTFLGHFYLPIGYELIEFGMIVSPGTDVIDLNSASITRYQASKYNPDTFEFVMSLPDSSLNSKRAYLVEKDANGNLMTLYDETIASSSYTYATDLFFSYYIEGSSYNKSIAIFNGTGSSVDLSSYSAKIYSNGASTASYTLPLSGTLAHGDVFVISHGSASAEILAQTDLTNSTLANFNGDDALELVKGTEIVDSIGQVGVDPGTAWTGSGVTTLDASLTRKSTVTVGRTNSTSTFDPSVEWDGHEVDYYTGLDSHSMDNMGPEAGSVSSIQAYIPNLSYFVEDSINLTNSYLKVYYTDGSAEVVALTPDLITGFSTSIAGSFDLTVTYQTKTDLLAYTVSETPGAATLLIHEVYGGGGNTGATYTNDYVVIYNNTTSDIDLSGYSVQYGSATGSTYTALALTGTISAKSYFLISLATSGAIGSDFPITPNQSGSINMSATSGKIALVSNTDLITIASDPDVIDFVGYGSANEYETAPTATLSSSLSAKRSNAIDTDDNSSDYTVDTPNLSYLSGGASLEDLVYSGYADYYLSIDSSTDVITDLALLLRSTIDYVSYGDARYVYTIYDNDSQVVLYDVPTSDSYRNVPATGLDGWGDGGDIITVDYTIALNREHVWACDDMRIMPINSDRTLDSYVGFQLNEDDLIFDYRPSNTDRGHYSDLHNLWNALESPNIIHSNHFFGEENGASVDSYLMNGIFYPGDEYKGDIARILFYMTLMYPYLTLVDQGSPDAVEGSINYGFLDILMQWNADDPVCYYEIQKNQLIFETQGNRNPFIDFYNQDFAELMFASGDPNILD